MKSSLTFRIGSRALRSIQKNGFDPQKVKVISGAAGGPKWLVLGQMDKFLFGEWLKDRKDPLHLIGSSIGAWRFAAAAQRDPIRGIEKFEKAYFAQTYSRKPTPKEISAEAEKLMGDYVSGEDIDYILDHPYLRLNVLAVNCKKLFVSEDKRRLIVGLLLATGLNAVHPKLLHTFFDRAVFLNSKEELSLFKETPHRLSLSAKNFRQALMASGSIPGVMLSVKESEDASHLSLRDGGILDYHLNLPYGQEVKDDELVLFPHYSSRVIPNWFDKSLRWRKHAPSYFENAVLISPSKEFVDSLPFKKIPDRNDFDRFRGRDPERLRYWGTVIRECQRMREELEKVFESGEIPPHSDQF